MSVPYKLEPYDIYKLKNDPIKKPRSKSITRNVVGVVEEFVNNNYDCCLVCECENGTQSHIEVTIINRVLKRENYINVKAVVRGSRVYLVKKSAWEAKKNES